MFYIVLRRKRVGSSSFNVEKSNSQWMLQTPIASLIKTDKHKLLFYLDRIRIHFSRVHTFPESSLLII